MSENATTEATPEVRIADLEGQVQFWKKLHDMTDARLTDLRKTFDEVIERAKIYEAIVNERVAALDAMKARVKYEINLANNDRYAEIGFPWREYPATIWMQSGKAPNITLYLGDANQEQADEAALALQVLAGIGREWERMEAGE